MEANLNYRRSTLNIFVVITVFFLILMFISDGVSKYLAIQGSDFSRVSLFVRLLFEMTIVGYLFIYIKKQKLVILTALSTLLVFFVIGQFLIENENNFIENFINFNKYIFLFLLYLFFQKLPYIQLNQRNFIYLVVKILFFTNVVCIFIGFFFGLDFFKSFAAIDYRFGYNGVFLAGNESSYVLICMLGFLYFRAYYEDGSKLFLLVAIIASLLSGMKAVYIFIALLFLFHMVYKINKFHFVWIIPLLIFVSKYIIEYLQNKEFELLISFFMKTLEEKGLFYALLSGRQEFIDSKFIPLIDTWNLFNFMIGGQDFPKYLIEMDFFDLLLFFGGFGTTIYIYLFYKLFVQKLLWHKFFTFFTFSLLVLSFFGGHFLTSATSAVYFSLIIFYFQDYRIKRYENNIAN